MSPSSAGMNSIQTSLLEKTCGWEMIGKFEMSPLISELAASYAIRATAAANLAPKLNPARDTRSASTKRRSV